MALRPVPPAPRLRALLALAGLAALLALALAPAPTAAAQAGVAGPSVTIALAQPALDLDAAGEATLEATVTNANGQVGGSVVLALTVPQGWRVVAEPDRFPLAAGEARVVSLAVRAPDAGAGDETGRLVVAATLTEAAPTGRSATATGALALQRVDPPVAPPPPVPWYATTAGIALLALAPLAAAGAAAFLLALRRRRLLSERAAAAAHAAWLDRETGVTVALLDAPRPFGARREIAFRVAVENASPRPRVALVRLDLPDGWRGAPSIPRLPLSPGERVALGVCVVAEDGVPPDAPATVHVVAKPEEAQERDERVAVEVVAPAARPSTAAGTGEAGRPLRPTANQRVPPT